MTRVLTFDRDRWVRWFWIAFAVYMGVAAIGRESKQDEMAAKRCEGWLALSRTRAESLEVYHETAMYRVYRDDIVCMDKLPLPSATLNGADPVFLRPAPRRSR